MSRGHGRVQEVILEATRRGGVYPVLHVAKESGLDITRLAVRQSFTRAAGTLADEGLVTLWHITVPTMHNELTGEYTGQRDITCVTAQQDLTDDDWRACRRLARRVFFPETMERQDAEHAEFRERQDADIAYYARVGFRAMGDDESWPQERVVEMLTASEYVPDDLIPAIVKRMREMGEEL